MKTALKEYVDNVFRGAPDSETVNMLRIEVLSDLEQRYSAELGKGVTPQQAYINAVSAMGDISGFIEQAAEADTQPVGFTDGSEQAAGLFRGPRQLDPKNIKAVKGAVVALMWIISFGLAMHLDNYWDDAWVMMVFTAALNVAINTAASVLILSAGQNGMNRMNRVKMLRKVKGGTSAIMWITLFGIYALAGESAFGIFVLGVIAQIIINTVFKLKINKYER